MSETLETTELRKTLSGSSPSAPSDEPAQSSSVSSAEVVPSSTPLSRLLPFPSRIFPPAHAPETPAPALDCKRLPPPPPKPSRYKNMVKWTGALLAGIAIAASVWLERDSVPFEVTVPGDLKGYLDQVGGFALTETDDVITVAPRVSLDPKGGFLVADSREAQVRHYSLTGDLLMYFGRKGKGPGEFTHLSAALRTAGGGVLAVDMGGKAVLFDEEGKDLLWSSNLPISPIHEAAMVHDSVVVLAGRRIGAGVSASLLHLWNTRSKQLVKSFFPVPAHRPELAGAYAFAGTSDVAVKGDTLAAVFALSDTLYLFDAQGRALEQIRIPFERFRPMGEMPPSGATFDAFQKWGESFSSISQVYWAPDGGFLIEYYDMRGMDPQWRLLHMTRDGRRLTEKTSSRLMAVDPGSGNLYFADPSSTTLDKWVAFRLRR